MIAVAFPSILFLIAIGPIPSILYFDKRFTELKYDPWKNFVNDSGPWCEQHHKFGLVKEKSKIVSKKILPISLSYDHRIIDGAEGARFCVYLGKCLGKDFAFKLAV